MTGGRAYWIVLTPKGLRVACVFGPPSRCGSGYEHTPHQWGLSGQWPCVGITREAGPTPVNTADEDVEPRRRHGVWMAV